MVNATELRAERRRPVVALDNFMKVRQRNRGSVFLLFEGEDSKYYGPRISTALNDAPVVYIECGGKDAIINILEIYFSAEDDLKDELVYGFRDRDFDDHLPSLDALYVTPTHSIENLYVTERAFMRILSAEFKIAETSNEDNNDLEACISHFRKMNARFHEVIRPLNVWIKARSLMESNGESTDRLHLDSLNSSNFFAVHLLDITKKYAAEKLDDLHGLTNKVSDERLQNAEQWFVGKLPNESFRGKYQMDFFKSFLALMKQDANSTNGVIFSKKRKCKVSLTGNILSDLSSHADTPECLSEFLFAIRKRLMERRAQAA